MKLSSFIYAHANVAAVQVRDCFSGLWVCGEHGIYSRPYAYVVMSLFLLFPSIGSCSSIVAILVNNETLVIVADSKETRVVNGVAVGTHNVCKIHAGKQSAWAIFGLVGDDKNGHIEPSIARIANTGYSASSKVMRLDELMFPYIHQKAEFLQKADPQDFQQFTKGDGNEIFSYLFAGFDDVGLTVSNRDYYIGLTNGKINVESKWAKDCPGKGCSATQMFVIGGEGAIQDYLVTHRQVMFPKTVQEAMDVAINLVRLQMTATPEFVGPPIETATIDGQGLHWSEANTVCPNGKKPSTKPLKRR